MLTASFPMAVSAFLRAASECVEALEHHRSAVALIHDSLLRPLRMEQSRLRDSILCGIQLVEGSMTACLAAPALSPWVNTAGVASMLRQAQELFCQPTDHKAFARVEDRLRQLSAPPPKSDTAEGPAADVLSAIRLCAAAAFAQGDMFQPVFKCRNALAAARLAYPDPFQAPLPAADEKYAQELVEIVKRVSEATNVVQQLVDDVTSELTEWFSDARHKEKELQDLHQWYVCCVAACDEWHREEHRRDASQAAIAQRIAHLQKELDLLVDEENLERIEFDRRCGKFLPRAGFPRVCEAVPPLAIRPVTADVHTRR